MLVSDTLAATNLIQYLAISILGNYQTKLPSELSVLIANSGCHIVEGNMTRLGCEFTATLLLSGNWSEIGKFEAYLRSFAQKYQLAIEARRTEPKPSALKLLPYTVYVTAPNTSGIVDEITQLFEREQLSINKIALNTYNAPHTGAAMLTLLISINIPITKAIGDIREQLLVFADYLNLDIVMEPEKD